MMKFLTRRQPNRKVGPLTFLAGLLLVSGILRFAGGPSSAIAKEIGTFGIQSETGMEAGLCEAAPDVARVLEVLSERETRIAARELQQADRAQVLSRAENDIAAKLEELEAVESRLASTLDMAVNAAEEDVARLTAVYENMKPKEAARLFETMAPEFAAGFLGRMRPEAAGKLVEGLSSEAAYSISVILAGRNASPKK